MLLEWATVGEHWETKTPNFRTPICSLVRHEINRFSWLLDGPCPPVCRLFSFFFSVSCFGNYFLLPHPHCAFVAFVLRHRGRTLLSAVHPIDPFPGCQSECPSRAEPLRRRHRLPNYQLSSLQPVILHLPLRYRSAVNGSHTSSQLSALALSSAAGLRPTKNPRLLTVGSGERKHRPRDTAETVLEITSTQAPTGLTLPLLPPTTLTARPQLDQDQTMAASSATRWRQ